MSRVILISPAHGGGRRAALVLNERGQFDLARRLRESAGAPLGHARAQLELDYVRVSGAQGSRGAKREARLPFLPGRRDSHR